MCDGCPALASIAGALLRKCERRKLSHNIRKQADCEDIVTRNLQAEGCSTWQEVKQEFATKLGEELDRQGFFHGSYSNVADAYSVLVLPLLKRAQQKKRGNEMAAMLECASVRLVLHAAFALMLIISSHFVVG